MQHRLDSAIGDEPQHAHEDEDADGNPWMQERQRNREDICDDRKIAFAIVTDRFAQQAILTVMRNNRNHEKFERECSEKENAAVHCGRESSKTTLFHPRRAKRKE